MQGVPAQAGAFHARRKFTHAAKGQQLAEILPRLVAGLGQQGMYVVVQCVDLAAGDVD